MHAKEVKYFGSKKTKQSKQDRQNRQRSPIMMRQKFFLFWQTDIMVLQILNYKIKISCGLCCLTSLAKTFQLVYCFSKIKISSCTMALVSLYFYPLLSHHYRKKHFDNYFGTLSRQDNECILVVSDKYHR